LIKEGVNGFKIVIDPGNKFVLSDTLGQLGAKGANHEAIRVGDTVFDNLRPQGIPYKDFINDLGGREFLQPPFATFDKIGF